VAEQIRQQEHGCAGLADLALAADLQGGLIQHGAHLGLLLRRRSSQPDGFGRLQSKQALLHARAITEWIRAALASRR
jgi:hypothetical protein